MTIPVPPPRDIARGAATVERALSREHNAFGLLRLVLALAVVVSHSRSVTSGNILDEPLTRATGYTLGEHAVNGFFAVSGFLVAMSLDRRGPRDYLVARALRILPGVAAAALVVALVLGPALTRLPLAEYLRAPGTWAFLRDTLTSFRSNASLPGVFADNPFHSPLGTVWTLRYEVMCYLGLLVAGLAGGLRRRWPVLALVIGLTVALVVGEAVRGEMPKGVETGLRLPLIFAAGTALYLWRGSARLSGLVLAALALGALVAQGSPAYRALLFLAEAYGAVWLALLPFLARPWAEPPADLSYGIYLYGWPIQQSLHALVPAAGPTALLAPSLVLTLMAAAASWYAIERPAIRLKARALRGRAPAAAPS